MKENKNENNKYLPPCPICKFKDECNSKQFGQGCENVVIDPKHYYYL